MCTYALRTLELDIINLRADVRQAMNCAKAGGRFILGSSHSIAVGSNYDNFMAMLDEYHKLCDY